MNYVVAVSGGVDSMVLLDMLVKENEHTLTVAHFDHGIRQNSAADARFVAATAQRYGLPFCTRRVELGPNASEEIARERRYEFLKSVATERQAQLVTAHHLDDLVETIAINLSRGTGWRGLDVLSDHEITRPLLRYTKQSLYEYAVGHELEWVEDETNATDAYLRNRIRARLHSVDESTRRSLGVLRDQQHLLAEVIDGEAQELATNNRYFMTMIDDGSAIELLRAYLSKFGLSLTRPQRQRLLHAVKTARSGTNYEAGQNVIVSFAPREFIVKHPL